MLTKRKSFCEKKPLLCQCNGFISHNIFSLLNQMKRGKIFRTRNYEGKTVNDSVHLLVAYFCNQIFKFPN